MSITKEQFNKLYSDDIKKKEYDQIVSQIDERFFEIAVTIVGKGNLHWIDYDNGDTKSEIDGHFDTDQHRHVISFTGEGKRNKGQRKFYEFYNMLDGEIPIQWLWEEDFKEQYEKLVQEDKIKEQEKKDKAKAKRKKRKEHLTKLQESIKNKLTKEELSAIIFKK